MTDLSGDVDDLKAIGHGASALFQAAIVVAIVAVVVSNGAKSADIITSFFNFVTWLVAQVVNPVTGGTPTTLTSSPGIADPGTVGEGGFTLQGASEHASEGAEQGQASPTTPTLPTTIPTMVIRP